MTAPQRDHPKVQWPRRLPHQVPCDDCGAPSVVAEGPPLDQPWGPWRFACVRHRRFDPLPGVLLRASAPAFATP